MKNTGTLYADILKAKWGKKKLLAILLDPDKIDWKNMRTLVWAICASPATHVFIGGSLVLTNKIDELAFAIKHECKLPVLLFPGNPSQISDEADGILFLSLLSGRNPDFLIGHQVAAAQTLKKSNLEIIPTGYLLIESGTKTAVEKVSKTAPMPIDNIENIAATAMAGEMLGNKLIYLEAGSGAKNAVPINIIQQVAQNIQIPLIVGGGITSNQAIEDAYKAGANLVVIGTAFENNINFFK
ncbi:MAG TPA: geranylgeranylglyceryl/heptaprenylglyceryl phosphate synthase [Flavobacterium sp.]|jgi:putative glycerol-1-phosphate prenyltransferase